MTTTRIDTRRSMKSVQAAICRLWQSMTGERTGPHAEKIQRRFAGKYAESMFESIHDAFIAKSRGMADELGEKWHPLAESTIACRPITRADIQQHHISSNRKRGLLTPKENALWVKIFKKKFEELFQGTVAHDEAKARAAKYAWWWLKTLGAKTRKHTLGNRNVPILIESGRLEKSFRPGKFFHWSYRPYNKDQIFEVGHGSITLGTKVPYAKYHQHGTSRHPARPFFPPKHKRKVWTTRAVGEAKKAILQTIEEIIK